MPIETARPTSTNQNLETQPSFAKQLLIKTANIATWSASG
jgi:hypothetical protein